MISQGRLLSCCTSIINLESVPRIPLRPHPSPLYPPNTPHLFHLTIQYEYGHFIKIGEHEFHFQRRARCARVKKKAFYRAIWKSFLEPDMILSSGHWDPSFKFLCSQLYLLCHLSKEKGGLSCSHTWVKSRVIPGFGIRGTESQLMDRIDPTPSFLMDQSPLKCLFSFNFVPHLGALDTLYRDTSSLYM